MWALSGRSTRLGTATGVGVLSLLLAAPVPALAKTTAPQHKPVKHAPETAEHALVHWVNVQRQHRGLAALAVSSDLTAVAHEHTAHMAKVDRVFHDSTLGSDVTGWLSLGEDVGSAVTLFALEKALLATPDDRFNLLWSGFRQVGVGTKVRDGLLYVTVLTRRPDGSHHR